MNLIQNISKSNNEKTTGPIFQGTFNDFYTYFNDYAKNKVPYLTKQYKKGSCELCGNDGELEAAHIRGKDRKALIKEAFDLSAKLLYDHVYSVDMKKFADEIKRIHSDPNNFHFLCHACHKEYDKPNSTINESDFKRKNNISSNTTSNKVKGNKQMTKTSAEWPFKKNKKGAIRFCESKGIAPDGEICLASIASSLRRGHEVYWADIKIDNIDKKQWIFLLHNQHKRIFHIIKIPAGTFTPDLRKAYWKGDKWDVSIKTSDYREVYTNFDFKPYITCDISYTQADIAMFG